MCLYSDHSRAGATGRRDPCGRILEDGAFGRRHMKQFRRAQVNIRRRLGPFHLVPVYNHLEALAQSCSIEHEIDIGALGVGSHSRRERFRGFQKLDNPWHQVRFEVVSQHVAKEPFFRGAMGKNHLGREPAADEIGYDFVVTPPVHAPLKVLEFEAQPAQVCAPSFIVGRHGIDYDAVKVENKRT